MTKKMEDRRFYVVHGFYAKTKEDKKQYINRAHQHRLHELLTAAQIDEHKKAGNIVELGVKEEVPADIAIAPAYVAVNDEEDN